MFYDFKSEIRSSKLSVDLEKDKYTYLAYNTVSSKNSRMRRFLPWMNPEQKIRKETLFSHI